MNSLASSARLLDPARIPTHLPRLTRIAASLCGSREAGEDLVQDTLERVLRSPRRVSSDDFAYLARALRNTHVDRVRATSRRAKTTTIDQTLEAELPAPDHTTAELQARDVLAAIRALPDPYRHVVLAVDVAGYSYADAAQALDIPVGTVMSRLYRGRHRVIQTIEGDRARGSTPPASGQGASGGTSDLAPTSCAGHDPS
jgi:RNA polymerase sigma-70 factor, ECF subfamily